MQDLQMHADAYLQINKSAERVYMPLDTVNYGFSPTRTEPEGGEALASPDQRSRTVAAPAVAASATAAGWSAGCRQRGRDGEVQGGERGEGRQRREATEACQRSRRG